MSFMDMQGEQLQLPNIELVNNKIITRMILKLLWSDVNPQFQNKIFYVIYNLLKNMDKMDDFFI
jgi:hypothetical protein